MDQTIRQDWLDAASNKLSASAAELFEDSHIAERIGSITEVGEAYFALRADIDKYRKSIYQLTGSDHTLAALDYQLEIERLLIDFDNFVFVQQSTIITKGTAKVPKPEVPPRPSGSTRTVMGPD